MTDTPTYTLVTDPLTQYKRLARELWVMHDGGREGSLQRFIDEAVPFLQRYVDGVVRLRAEQAESERDAARAALRKYGEHTHTCRLWINLPQSAPCTCGFERALEEQA